jgi:eukaryotic-like serine/threonine-protein kinase
MKECQLCKSCYNDEVATCPKDGMPTMHTIAGEPVLEGKYQIESRLGQGGMGVVYKARHAYLKTQLAIKIILPDLVGNDPQLVTRFRQEALAAAAIRHQNVVAVTDYGVIGGSIPFLVMEYVEGESLHDMLAREQKLSPERAFEVISAICAGVGAAHHQGIVHRDLKPLNVMICSNRPSLSQSVKILDFGLAKIKSGELLGSFIQAQTTGLMGSPYYMAPEQWADDEPDSRSDIYSLGVMLYQMLAGDVPFKGSSIPAIMKKHISDPAPKFVEMGASVSPALEAAVLHTLEKDKEKRTGSVEQMIVELKEAIYPAAIGIHTTSSGAKPVTRLTIKTEPHALVFVDSVAVGQTGDDGWIALNGIQAGNHNLKISKEGYETWYADVVCDSESKQVVAELRSSSEAIPKPPAATIAYAGGVSPDTPQNFSTTQETGGDPMKTAVQKWDTGSNIGSQSMPPKRSIFSPVVLGVAGLFLLFVLGGAGIGGAYMLGLFGGATAGPNGKTPEQTKTPAEEVPTIPADMVQIPGGTFTMGRDDGGPWEKGEHRVVVPGFWMDRYEVTNEAFYEFVAKTGYERIPDNWVEGRPRTDSEKHPVQFVSYDDAVAFAKWRSERDKQSYRLPSDREWEYAARNGAKNNLYPWGDKFDPKCALIDQPSNQAVDVGTRSCPNDWGVHDLIGNVFEWTSTEISVHPNQPEPEGLGTLAEPYYMVRGGSAVDRSTGENRITSTARFPSPASRRSVELGFRLVRTD